MSPSTTASPRTVDRLLLGLFALLTIGAATIGGREYFKWRNSRIANNVGGFIAQRDFDSALKALSSLDVDWLDRETADRVRIAVWSVTDPSLAVDLLESRIDSGDATPDEVKLAIQLASQARLPEQALRLLTHLPPEAQADADVAVAKALLAIEQGEMPAAVEALKAALAHNPSHRGASLLRARLLSNSQNYEERVRGHAALRSLGAGSDLTALEARIHAAILRERSDSPGDREEALRAIFEHPLAAQAHLLRRVDVLTALVGASVGIGPKALEPFASRLLAADPDSPRALAAWIYVSQENGSHRDANAHLARLRALDPKGTNTRLLDARQHALDGDPDAALKLYETAEAPGPQDVPFLTSLFTPGRPIAPELQARAAELAMRADDQHFGRWLLACRRLIELRPEQRDALIGQLKTRAHDERVIPAANALLQLGEFATVRELVTPLLPQKDPTVRALAFDSLVGLRALDEAESLAQLEPAETVHGALMRARLALLRDQTAHATDAWKAAYTPARRGRDGRAVLRLAVGAAQLGMQTQAVDAFLNVRADLVTGTLPCDARAAATWLEVSLRERDARTALEASKLLGNLQGSDSVGRVWTIYLGLLLNERLLDDKDAARLLVESRPEDRGARALLALAQLKTGQSTQALTTLGAISDEDALAATPRQVRVITSAVLAANSRVDSARTWRASLTDDPLLPEEESLLAESFARLASTAVRS